MPTDDEPITNHSLTKDEDDKDIQFPNFGDTLEDEPDYGVFKASGINSKVSFFQLNNLTS